MPAVGSTRVLVPGPSPKIRSDASSVLAPSQCTSLPKWVTNVPAGNGTCVVGIEIRAAAHPPSAVEHRDEAVVRVEVRTAEMVSFQPFGALEVEPGFRRVAHEHRVLHALGARRVPLDLVGQLIDERRRIELGRMARHGQHKRETRAKYQPRWVSCHLLLPFTSLLVQHSSRGVAGKGRVKPSARRFDRMIMRSAAKQLLNLASRGTYRDRPPATRLAAHAGLC